MGNHKLSFCTSRHIFLLFASRYKIEQDNRCQPSEQSDRKKMASKKQNDNESMAEKFIPSVKAEEEDEPEEEPEEEEEEDEEDLIDPAVEIKEKCAEDSCTTYKSRLDECNDRVTSKSATIETCLEEILDFYHCVDHCAGDKIFATLK